MRKLVALSTVLLLIGAGTYLLVSDRDDTPDGYTYVKTNGDSSHVSFNLVGDAVELAQETYYLAVGAYVEITEDEDGDMTPISVTSGYGLEDLGDRISGTITKVGTIEIKCDSVGGIHYIKIIAVKLLERGSAASPNNGYAESINCSAVYYIKQGTTVSLSADSYDDEFSWYESYAYDMTAGSGLAITNNGVYGTASVPGTYYVYCNEYGNDDGWKFDTDFEIKLVIVESGYSVSYDSNGGSSSPSTQTGVTSVTLPSPGTKAGHTFDGWYTAKSGGTRVGGAGDKYTATSNVTLYAHWSQITLSVSSVPTQYVVVGKSVSFAASTSPSNAPVTYTVSGVPSGLTVTINGSQITCKATAVGAYTFSLIASSNGYASGSTAVVVEVVNLLSFTNTPLAGSLNM